MPPRNQPTPRKPSVTPQPKPQFEVVDPIWLIKALGISFLAALLCTWLTLCLLFYQGQWQLVLHPTHTIDQTPASAYETIHFDATTTGQPRLTAWWIPAESPAAPNAPLSFQPIPKYAGFTILYLHDGSQSLSATVPTLARLHQAGLNIFAIDYRGFGQSDASSHPTEARMAEDTSAALNYGTGLGASLAANLAQARPELPAAILDNPDPDPTATAVTAHPSHFIPVRHLFRERFDIATPLATLKTPKLLIAGSPNSTTSTTALQTLFHHAASPSLTVTLQPKKYDENYQDALTRFLDEYLAPPSADSVSP
jgi:uncharacterized protein